MVRINRRLRARTVGVGLLVLFTFVGVIAASENEKPQYWSREAKEGWEAAHEYWVGPKPWERLPAPVAFALCFFAGLFVFLVIFSATRDIRESASSDVVRRASDTKHYANPHRRKSPPRRQESF